MATTQRLTFRGGWAMALVPVLVFVAASVLIFVVLDVFDLAVLAMFAIVALLVASALARDRQAYWRAVAAGVGSPSAVAIVLILLVVNLFSALLVATGTGDGLVWAGTALGVGGGVFTAFVFVAACVLAVSTGTSIGTMFAAFPVFYPAGVVLGAHPALLAGAILSGAIFGDNLAPVSDTTILSAGSQRFRRKDGVADIAGVVASRARYALIAAAISAVLFLLFGGIGDIGTVETAGDPVALIMLIPAAVMLVVAFVTRDIYTAIGVGLVVGTITGLAAGLLGTQDIIGVEDGAVTGYLVEGITGAFGTIALVIAVFGIVGVLEAAGVLNRAIDTLARSRLAHTPRGVELITALGVSLTTVVYGGVNSASMITFGPVADELGARVNLHPYRRANLVDCFAMGVSCVVPVLSAFLFIASSLTAGYENAEALSPAQIFTGAFYPLVLTAVMLVAVTTGLGRRYEGQDGIPVRHSDHRSDG